MTAALRRWTGVVLEVALYIGAGLAILASTPARLHVSMFRPLEPAPYGYETWGWLLKAIVVDLVLFVAMRRIGGGWSAAKFGLGAPGCAWRENVATMSAWLAVTNAGMLAIPGLSDPIWAAYGMRTEADLWLFLLWISPIVAGLGEELVFRSMLEGRLLEADPAWGLVVSALVFALLHRFQGIVPLLGMHVPAALLAALVYARKRDLVSQVIGHALFDVIVFAQLWLVHAGGVSKLDVFGGVLAASLMLTFAMRATWAEIGRWSRETMRALWRRRSQAVFALVAVPVLLWLFELR